MIRINLMSSARLASRARVKRARAWAVACLSWGAALGVGCAYLTAFWAREGEDHVSAQQGEAEKRLAASAAQFKSLRGRTQVVQARLDSARMISNSPDWADLLELLSALREETIIESIEVSRVETPDKPDPAPVRGEQAGAAGAGGGALGPGRKAPPRTKPEAYTLRLAGVARTHQAAADFMLRLEKAGPFSGVRLMDSHSREITGLMCTGFSITCTLTDRAPAKPDRPDRPDRPGQPDRPAAGSSQAQAEVPDSQPSEGP